MRLDSIRLSQLAGETEETGVGSGRRRLRAMSRAEKWRRMKMDLAASGYGAAPGKLHPDGVPVREVVVVAFSTASGAGFSAFSPSDVARSAGVPVDSVFTLGMGKFCYYRDEEGTA